MNERSHASGRRGAQPAVSVGAVPFVKEGPAPPPHVTLERALCELELVHRLEQARLLRMACRIAWREARAAAPVAPVAPDAPGADGDTAALVERWRCQCASALHAARADGLEAPAALQACARRATSAWPPARALALASLELDDCRAGRRLAER